MSDWLRSVRQIIDHSDKDMEQAYHLLIMEVQIYIATMDISVAVFQKDGN